jgi:hypothetical protein
MRPIITCLVLRMRRSRVHMGLGCCAIWQRLNLHDGGEWKAITLRSVPARTQLRPLIPVGWAQPGFKLPGGKILFGDSGTIEGIFVCEVLKEMFQIQKHPRIKNTLARSPANVCASSTTVSCSPAGQNPSNKSSTSNSPTVLFQPGGGGVCL